MSKRKKIVLMKIQHSTLTLQKYEGYFKSKKRLRIMSEPISEFAGGLYCFFVAMSISNPANCEVRSVVQFLNKICGSLR